MLQWIEHYVKGLVRFPDQVSLSTKEGALVTLVEIAVAPEDADLLTGQHNRLTRALGSVLSLSGARQRRRFVLQIAG